MLTALGKPSAAIIAAFVRAGAGLRRRPALALRQSGAQKATPSSNQPWVCMSSITGQLVV
jgi:hypothetical protein